MTSTHEGGFEVCDSLIYRPGKPWPYPNTDNFPTLLHQVDQIKCPWLKVGFLGCARIGKTRTWAAVHACGGSVVAVGSRDVAKAATYIAECGGTTDTCHPMSYEEVCTSPNVNVVYLPIPTALRAPYILLAAKNKKHIVCEKPPAVSAAVLKELLDVCEEHGVQFLDGTMLSHGARLGVICNLLSSSPPTSITFELAFPTSEEFLQSNVRAQSNLEPLGCLGDLGWYCLRYTLYLMDMKEPDSINATCVRKTAEGVPTEMTCVLTYAATNTRVTFLCSFHRERVSTMSVTNGQHTIRLLDFVNGIGDVMKYELDGSMVEVGGEAVSFQTGNLWRTMGRSVVTGKPDPFWHIMSLKTQKLMDDCFSA
eukprot:PhF_6_TR20845/c0_g1_i1/m.30024